MLFSAYFSFHSVQEQSISDEIIKVQLSLLLLSRVRTHSGMFVDLEVCGLVSGDELLISVSFQLLLLMSHFLAL